MEPLSQDVQALQNVLLRLVREGKIYLAREPVASVSADNVESAEEAVIGFTGMNPEQVVAVSKQIAKVFSPNGATILNTDRTITSYAPDEDKNIGFISANSESANITFSAPVNIAAFRQVLDVMNVELDRTTQNNPLQKLLREGDIVGGESGGWKDNVNMIIGAAKSHVTAVNEKEVAKIIRDQTGKLDELLDSTDAAKIFTVVEETLTKEGKKKTAIDKAPAVKTLCGTANAFGRSITGSERTEAIMGMP